MPQEKYEREFKKGALNKFETILGRIQKRNACGIIYNMSEASMISFRLQYEHKKRIIPIDGQHFYSYSLLRLALGKIFNVKNMQLENVPPRIGDAIIYIHHADHLQSSIVRFLDECNKLKIPVMLLFKSIDSVKVLRNYSDYYRFLTIEQDFSEYYKIIKN